MINLKPIGYVESPLRQPGTIDCQNVISKLVISREFAQGLDSIEKFSHIIVIYWMHQVTGSGTKILKVHPRSNQKLPLMGVFATRSPHRTNPIGISTVKLLKHTKNILLVQGLDAIDSSPVLDIKPYLTDIDLTANIKVPSWVNDNY